VSTAIAPIPFITTIVVRFSALIPTGVPAESDTTKGTGVCSAAPHFSQKMRPLPAKAPHREQVALGVLMNRKQLSYSQPRFVGETRQCHNRALFLRRRPCQFPLLRFSSKMRYGSRTAPEFRNLFFQRHSYTQATCNGPTIFERRDELPAMMPRRSIQGRSSSPFLPAQRT